jgi:hypothetical protein
MVHQFIVYLVHEPAALLVRATPGQECYRFSAPFRPDRHQIHKASEPVPDCRNKGKESRKTYSEYFHVLSSGYAWYPEPQVLAIQILLFCLPQPHRKEKLCVVTTGSRRFLPQIDFDVLAAYRPVTTSDKPIGIDSIPGPVELGRLTGKCEYRIAAPWQPCDIETRGSSRLAPLRQSQAGIIPASIHRSVIGIVMADSHQDSILGGNAGLLGIMNKTPEQ